MPRIPAVKASMLFGGNSPVLPALAFILQIVAFRRLRTSAIRLRSPQNKPGRWKRISRPPKHRSENAKPPLNS